MLRRESDAPVSNQDPHCLQARTDPPAETEVASWSRIASNRFLGCKTIAKPPSPSAERRGANRTSRLVSFQASALSGFLGLSPASKDIAVRISSTAARQ